MILKSFVFLTLALAYGKFCCSYIENKRLVMKIELNINKIRKIRKWPATISN
jgi:hypothetical protein